MTNRLNKIRCFLFDMDGTIYLGKNLLPGAKETLECLENKKIDYYFLTNNSSQSSGYYQTKLAKMGIAAGLEKIIISTHSLLCYLEKKAARRVFILGTKALQDIFAAAGYQIAREYGEQIDYVVIGYDTTLAYENLTIACQYIDANIPYVATHPDVRCPVEGGRYMPDCGSFLSLIKTATGKECEMITGKPSRYMVETVLAMTGFHLSELAIVGDRLYTDIALGKQSGITSILVLSGEATREEVKTCLYQPDLILEGIKGLINYL